MLGVRQISSFDGNFLYHSKSIVALSLNMKRYLTCDHFLLSYGCLNNEILANLGQITRDIFSANIRKQRFNMSQKLFQIG